jgi:hypothetical protein
MRATMSLSTGWTPAAAFTIRFILTGTHLHASLGIRIRSCVGRGVDVSTIVVDTHQVRTGSGTDWTVFSSISLENSFLRIWTIS